MAGTHLRTDASISSKGQPISKASGTALGLLWLAFGYLWILPLLVPRGQYLWGHYRVRDLVPGVPVALATVWAMAVSLSPPLQRRRVGLAVAVALLSLLSGIAAVEAIYVFGIRGIGRPNPWRDDVQVSRLYFQPDPVLGFKRKPLLSRYDPQLVWNFHCIPAAAARRCTRNFYYRTDENGFRNPPGIRRAEIVCIGDHLTEAIEVAESDTFVQRVAAGSGLKAVNLGVSDYALQQQLVMLQRYGLAYKPRFVVWQIAEGDDLRETERFPGYIAHPNQSKKTTLLSRYTRDSLIGMWLEKTLPPEPKVYGAMLHQSDGTTIPLEACEHAMTPARHPEGWSEMKRVLEAGYRLCCSHGIRMVVMFVPTRERTLAPYIRFGSDQFRDRWLPPDALDGVHDFGRCLDTFCRQMGCPFLNALPALQARAAHDNRHLFFPGNASLDTDGHKVVGQLLLNWLKEKDRSAAFLSDGHV